MYRINEIFYSVQGEGHWSGRPAVFIRFSGCNLWSGRESDRANAICRLCDTDFVDYTEMTARDIAQLVNAIAPDMDAMIVFTGGEPALQLDQDLVNSLAGRYIAVETNGTKPLQAEVNWICVSPKTPTVRVRGDELKLVYPQSAITPEMFDPEDYRHAWLSPMDGPDINTNTELAYDYCLAHPQWRLNTQMHKTIGVR